METLLATCLAVALANGDRATCQVDGASVWIMPRQEVSWYCGLVVGVPSQGYRYRGCYQVRSRVIISEPSLEVLEHEMKHHQRGGWHK